MTRTRLKGDNKVVSRVELIAEALQLSDAEIEAALLSDLVLAAFARRYNQSLDWILDGDVREMILRLALSQGSR